MTRPRSTAEEAATPRAPLPEGLRILHVLDHGLPLQSGYTFRTLRILQAQRRRGWEPFAVTSPKHEESWRRPTERIETVEGYRFYRSGAVARTRVPIVGELRLIETMKRRIEDAIQAERPQVIHAHSPVLNAIAALRAGRRHGLPVVYEIRAFWEDAAVDHGTYAAGSWKYRLVRALETDACRRADGVAVICRGLQDDLVARGIDRSKFVVIYNGIDPDETRIAPPDEEGRATWGLAGKRVIGFLGSFYRYEGLDLLIEAVARLRRDRDDVVLLLVGGGEAREDLQGRIRALGIEKHVIVTGRVPHERIPGIYGLVDVLAYPRKSMRLTELVTPLKPLEAMAMGKVFVASDVGGHRELVRDGETGVLFPAGDVDALTRSLARLLDDATLRRAIETRQVPWVREHHTWDRTTEPYGSLYARALAGRSR
jgi:PEP-CTERM/exosortase A-associated glycosyltransferase